MRYVLRLLKQPFPISVLKARHKMDNKINNRTCEVIKDGRYRAFLNVQLSYKDIM